MYNIWLTFWRKKIVKCYINRYLHLNITINSRNEKIYKQIKTQFIFSIENLFLVFEFIELFFKNVLIDWEDKLIKAKNIIFYQLRIDLFRELIVHVISFALWKILKQYKMLLKNQKKNDESLKLCIDVFTKTLSLFYNHRLNTLIQLHRVFIIRKIHSHWCYIKSKFRKIISMKNVETYMNLTNLIFDSKKMNLTNDDDIISKHLYINEFVVIRNKKKSKNSLNKKK